MNLGLAFAVGFAIGLFAMVLVAVALAFRNNKADSS